MISCRQATKQSSKIILQAFFPTCKIHLLQFPCAIFILRKMQCSLTAAQGTAVLTLKGWEQRVHISASSVHDRCQQVQVRILCSWVCMPSLPSNAHSLQELYAASFILFMHTMTFMASSHSSHEASCPLCQSCCYCVVHFVIIPHGCSYLCLIGSSLGPQRGKNFLGWLYSPGS